MKKNPKGTLIFRMGVDLKNEKVLGPSDPILGYMELHRRLQTVADELEDIFAELRVRKLERASKNCNVARCWVRATKDNVPYDAASHESRKK